MTDAKSQFLYVTYIRTTVDELWKALTTPEIIKKFWFDMTIASDWTVGSPWSIRFEDGRLADSGEILEIERGKRLVIKWRNEFRPELKEEGYSRCVFELEPADGAVKLTVHHSIDRENAQMIGAVSGGWPKVLSNLKSLLETGRIALGEAYPNRAAASEAGASA